MNIAIVFHTKNGHTGKLAEAISQGVSQVSAKCTMVEIGAMHTIPWHTLHEASAIIFGSPTFMGNVSAPFKSFMDDSGDFWLDLPWINKIAAGFTISTSPSGDKSGTLIALMTFAMQHGMIWVGQDQLGSIHSKDGLGINEAGSWIGLMATSNPDKSKLIGEGDKETAIIFGRRIANIAKHLATQSGELS